MSLLSGGSHLSEQLVLSMLALLEEGREGEREEGEKEREGIREGGREGGGEGREREDYWSIVNQSCPNLIWFHWGNTHIVNGERRHTLPSLLIRT